MEPEFPSNSHGPLHKKGAKKEKSEKVVEKIVTGEVIQKPKGLGRRFKELFIGDGSKGAMQYVFGDVLIPALKNMFVDAVSKGAERAVYGTSSPRRGSLDYMGRSRIEYSTPIIRSQSGSGRSASLPHQPPFRSKKQSMDEIILGSRDDAEIVLQRMNDIINDYEAVSVADLKELLGLPNSFIDNKWGWTSLAGSDVRSVREGFLIDLPFAEPLET